MLRGIIAGIVVIIVGFLVFLSMSLENDASLLPSALKGKQLPSFSAYEVVAPGMSAKILTDEDIKGPALLNIWATWCPTCEAEHDALKAIGATGVPIYGVDYKDNTLKAYEWLRDLGNPYLFTVADESGKIGLNLGVYGAPETYFLDANNIIVYRHVGEMTVDLWNNGFKGIYEASFDSDNPKALQAAINNATKAIEVAKAAAREGAK
ncbi:DsbE family thiol:disulfide interchange protein [Ignatzschineria sp. LJL83]